MHHRQHNWEQRRRQSKAYNQVKITAPITWRVTTLRLTMRSSPPSHWLQLERVWFLSYAESRWCYFCTRRNGSQSTTWATWSTHVTTRRWVATRRSPSSSSAQRTKMSARRAISWTKKTSKWCERWVVRQWRARTSTISNRPNQKTRASLHRRANRASSLRSSLDVNECGETILHYQCLTGLVFASCPVQILVFCFSSNLWFNIVFGRWWGASLLKNQST